MNKKNAIRNCIPVFMIFWLTVIVYDFKNWLIDGEVWGIWQYINVGTFVLFIIVVKNYFRKTKI